MAAVLAMTGPACAAAQPTVSFDGGGFSASGPLSFHPADFDVPLPSDPEPCFDGDSGGFKSLNTFNADLAAARRRASEIMENAVANARDSHWRGILREVWSSLENVPVKWLKKPGYDDYEGCHSNRFAFVKPGLQTIYICRRITAYSHKISADYLAQILIHESVHVGGNMDECDATQIEVFAMMWSGAGMAFYNSYTNPLVCNIQWK